jgi:hypothetical protein
MSPSTRINFCLTSANTSVKPSGGSGCQNFSQTPREARNAKLKSGVMNGPGVTLVMRPSCTRIRV